MLQRWWHDIPPPHTFEDAEPKRQMIMEYIIDHD